MSERAHLPLADRVTTFLRTRHPLKTPANVEADTGIPSGTVQKWLDRGSAPSALRLTQLWLAYGPEFLAAIVDRAPDWLDDAVRAREAARLKAEIALREARLARIEP